MTDRAAAFAGSTPERERILALGLAVVAWAAALAYWWNHWAPDLSAVYFAARLWHEGLAGEIYKGPEVFFGSVETPSWVQMRDALGHPDEVLFAYVYPPLWAVLLSPLAGAVGPLAFFNIVAVAQLAMLAAAPFLAWRIAGRPGTELIFAVSGLALAFAAAPGLTAQFQMQPQITVAFLILLAFERLSAGRQVSAGMALGLATALKLSPLIFVLLFLRGRRWRAILAFALTSGGLGLASLALAGIETNRAFLAQLSLVSSILPFDQIDWSLRPMIHTAGELLGLIPADPVGLAGRVNLAATPRWLSATMTLVLVLGIAALWRATRPLPRQQALAARLPTLAILATLTGPLGWSHHYLLPLMFVPALTARFSLPVAAALIAGLVLLLAPPLSPADLIPLEGHAQRMAPALIPVAIFAALAVAFPVVYRRRAA